MNTRNNNRLLLVTAWLFFLAGLIYVLIELINALNNGFTWMNAFWVLSVGGLLFLMAFFLWSTWKDNNHPKIAF